MASVMAVAPSSKHTKPTKPTKHRSSDVNFDKLCRSMVDPDGRPVLPRDVSPESLEGAQGIVTKKMDGTQVNGECDGVTISNLCTHHGSPIGLPGKVYKSPADFDPLVYQQGVDLAPHFEEYFDAYCELVKLLLPGFPGSTSLRIYMEVMLPNSPLKIPYPDIVSKSVYIFEVIGDTGQRKRVDQEFSDLIHSLGLTPVPFVSTGAFTPDYFTTLMDYLREESHQVCEGLILHFPMVPGGPAFKLKPGRFHDSSHWEHITPEMYDVPFWGEMSRLLIEMIKSTKAPLPGTTKKKKGKKGKKGKKCKKSYPVIDTLMSKEFGHDDWAIRCSQVPKHELGKFFQSFARKVSNKLETENPDLFTKLGQSGVEGYVMSKAFQLFRKFM